MIPRVPKTWPPIIQGTALPRAIAWRDRIGTVLMWLLLAWLCRHPLHALWDVLTHWFAGGRLRFTGLPPRWEALEPYFIAIAVLAVWELAWMGVTLWRRAHYAQAPQPVPLTLEEEARGAHCTVDDLIAWRRIRIVTVGFTENGAPKIVPPAADS
jgi:PgaD-like protein